MVAKIGCSTFADGALFDGGVAMAAVVVADHEGVRIQHPWVGLK